jgi:hypothetical protein
MFQVISGKRELFIRKAGKLEAQRIIADLAPPAATVQTPPPQAATSEFLVPFPESTADQLRHRLGTDLPSFLSMQASVFCGLELHRNPKSFDALVSEADWQDWKSRSFQIVRLNLISGQDQFAKLSIDGQAAVLRLVSDRALKSKNWILK